MIPMPPAAPQLIRPRCNMAGSPEMGGAAMAGVRAEGAAGATTGRRPRVAVDGAPTGRSAERILPCALTERGTETAAATPTARPKPIVLRRADVAIRTTL